MSKRKEIDKAIAHLMDWAEQPEWIEMKMEIFDKHLLKVAEHSGLGTEDFMNALIENNLSDIMYGFCFEDLASRRFEPGDRNLTTDFLKRRGWREGVRGRRYLRQLSESVVSLYEVIECVQGSHCDLVDLVRGGKPVRVYEQMGTRDLVKWDHIAARVLPGDGKRIFSGAILPFSSEMSQALLKILEGIRKEVKKSGADLDILEHSAHAFSRVWLMNVMETLQAPLPEMVTRDGEALVFTETRFTFDQSKRNEIVTLLDHAPDWDRENEESYIWAWLSGDSTGAGEMFDLNGFLEMTELDLRLEVNSMNRVDKGKAALAELLGDLVKPTLTKMLTPEQVLANRGLSEEGGQNAGLDESDIDPAELASLMTGHLDQHYRQALDESIPMLGGDSPRSCVKTKRGRKKVIDWLKYLENQEYHRAVQDGTEPYDFRWMWKELGLKRASEFD